MDQGRVHRLGRINAKKQAKLLDSKVTYARLFAQADLAGFFMLARILSMFRGGGRETRFLNDHRLEAGGLDYD